jgi:hypothetical protein
VVARPYTTLATPWAVFDHAKQEDVAALPRVELALGLVALFAVAMGFMWLERDWPLAKFRAQVEKIAAGEAEELDLAHLIRKHRKIGDAMHRAIDSMVARGGGLRHKPKANLDEILGPAPDNLASSAFSFGEEPAASGGSGMLQPKALPPPPAPSAARAAPPPTPGKAPALPPPKPTGDDEEPSRSVRFDAAEIGKHIANSNGAMTADEEEHYREVFAKFVTLRQQCGESTADLTFERFLGTLQKHRAQIMQVRPEARSVRFTVYSKEGKAALKAAPRKA